MGSSTQWEEGLGELGSIQTPIWKCLAPLPLSINSQINPPHRDTLCHFKQTFIWVSFISEPSILIGVLSATCALCLMASSLTLAPVIFSEYCVSCWAPNWAPVSCSVTSFLISKNSSDKEADWLERSKNRTDYFGLTSISLKLTDLRKPLFNPKRLSCQFANRPFQFWQPIRQTLNDTNNRTLCSSVNIFTPTLNWTRPSVMSELFLKIDCIASRLSSKWMADSFAQVWKSWMNTSCTDTICSNPDSL